MKKLTLLAISALIIPAGQQALAETYTVDPAHSEFGFSIKHLGINNVRGEFSDFTATLDISSNDPGAIKQVPLSATSEPLNNLNVTINQVELAACPEVVAYVSVTDQADFPVDGLLAADFTITEGGASVGMPSDTSFVGEVTEPISIALVMDNSSSMEDIDIAEMNRSALNIIGQLAPLDEVEIIKFDRQVYVEQVFTSDQALLTAAINQVRDGSGTALYDALQQAIDDTANQATKRKAVIVITDGNDNSSAAGINDIISDAETGWSHHRSVLY